MLLTAFTLAVLHYLRPQFKYPWLLAIIGAVLSIASIFIWKIHFPINYSLPPWEPEKIFTFIPTWLGDGISWPYALALCTLAAAVILTSVVRAENEPLAWAGTLVITAFGILAVTAANPLTLILAWSVIDLAELIIMTRSTDGERENQGVVIAFSVRLAGTAFLLWAHIASISGGTPLDLRSIPPQLGIYLLIASGLRLGILPLHLPYQKENVVRRGFGTTIRLVSASASLVILARIQAVEKVLPFTPYLLILAAISALYSSWMWLRSSDEISGRPFWVLAVASLAMAASLRGNPTGSAAWGAALLTCGAALFLFSARQKNILWIPLLSIWVMSGLPFSLNASVWKSGNHLSWIYTIFLLPAHAFMMTGFLKHALKPGETSLESQHKWVKLIYPTGLLLTAACGILLGFWGWNGALTIGLWWFGLIVILLAAGSFYLSNLFSTRFSTVDTSSRWTQIRPIRWLYEIFFAIFRFGQRITDIFTTSLEGDGGLLWSLLLLVLIISILFTRGQ